MVIKKELNIMKIMDIIKTAFLIIFEIILLNIKIN